MDIVMERALDESKEIEDHSTVYCEETTETSENSYQPTESFERGELIME
ncbi:hypothetical protein AWZ03_014922, partial [Drosophila navojoa]